MPDEIIVSTDNLDTNTNETALTEAPINLNEESLALISQIIASTDDQKTRELTQLFNNKNYG